MKNKILGFLDTETTGLLEPLGNKLENYPHIIEFYILFTDEKFNEIDSFYTLIKPPIPIPGFITKITNITNEMVEKAPSFEDVSKVIKKRLKFQDVLIGQNLPFDIGCIDIEFRRLDQRLKIKPDCELFCTVAQSMHLKGIRMNSNELHKAATGKEIVGIHRAKEDVLAMVEYYKFLIGKK